MTEKDVMTALECCTDGTGKGIIQAVVDLIYDKNYKLDKYAEEINRLQADKEALIAGQETLQKHIAEQKAEIERLKKALNTDFAFVGTRCSGKTKRATEIIKFRVETIRTEAIKEFAEKVKIKTLAMVHSPDLLSSADYIECIDSITKEMLAEKCANNTTNCTEKCVTAEYCIVCGKHIPEGRQICPMCESRGEVK